MIKGPRAYTHIPTGTITDCAIDDTYIYVSTTQAAFRKYDRATLTNTLTVIASSLTSTGIALIDASSSIMSFTGSNLYFVENSTGALSNITTNAAGTYYTYGPQQIAANPSAKMGIATKSSTGSVTLINGTTFALSSLTVSSLSGQNATCVVHKSDSSNFLIGTTDAKVHEIDTLGTVIKSLTLPITNRYGGALTQGRVDSMSYYNGLLLLVDTAGILRLYDWTQGTPSPLDQLQLSTWNGNQHTTLSNNSSGVCYITRGYSAQFGNRCIHEVMFDKGKIFIEDTWFGFGFSTVFLGSCVRDNDLFIHSTGTTSDFSTYKFEVSSASKVNVTTRIQDPVSVDVPGRIIRIRDAGIGRSIVEQDLAISAGATSLPCTSDRNYIELSLITSPNKWDIREFQS